ncbi:MAG TPA: membrane protein insertase YidC [Candidatus Cloacimonadota bacterium]|nr:membrane protein insertase YidC [Candidatus Cloacimonadota bacterium]
MNKDTLIGILLIFLIFILSEQFIWKKSKPTQAPPKAQTVTQPADTVKVQTEPQTQVSTIPSLVEPDMKTAAINDNIILENDSLKVVFSNRGGVIKAVYLKKFFQSDRSFTQLIPPGHYLANTVLLSENTTTDLKNLPFDYELTQVNGMPAVHFYFTPEPDRMIEKTYVLDHNYGVRLNLKIHSVYSLVGYSLEYGSGINDTEIYSKTRGQDYRFYAQVDNALIKRNLQKLLKGSETLPGKTDWAAIRSKYFVLACKNQEPILINSVKADTANGSPSFVLTAKRDNPSVDWDEHFILYLGPADYRILKIWNGGLENVAERGAAWLRWLVDIFAWFLKFLYKLIPNYGVVIIIFSLVIKVLLHPLTHKSMDASLKMQKIQPQVQALQQKYKNDPKRMQEEMAKLYKEAGASPLGGCLPLLLQMPVFFALYTVLRYSLDMRQAHFFGWLKDLSEPDPYYILPILMGVFMIVQSLMLNPKKQEVEKMDEKQQAMQQSQRLMAWIMPVIMFFIFKSMPAGLVLYWTVFNILSIIQQYYLQRHFAEKEK